MQTAPYLKPITIPAFTWISSIVVASVVLTLVTACAAPFAAFAAVAAMTLSRRDGTILLVLAWLANQVVGFGLLHYPWTIDTAAWGLALLIVPILAMIGARLCLRLLGHASPAVCAPLAFLSAFAVYEGLLLAVTLAAGAGTEAYEPHVVAEVLALNAAVFAGLLVTSRLRLPWRVKPQAPARSVA